MPAIRLSHVSFSYSSAVPIIRDASFDLGPGWAGLVGANGAGKSTLLSLIAGLVPPLSGHISVDPSDALVVVCPQRIDDLTDEIETFALAWDAESYRLRTQLELDPEQINRWATLSPGERKRWQIGSALIREPDVLLLDEPTNHLDSSARSMLIEALRNFGGCGIVVSHDRNVLWELTTKTIRVHSGTAELWNGSYESAKSGWESERAELVAGIERMKSEQAKLERRLNEQRQKSAEQDAKRIKERRSAGKHDLDTRGTAATYKHERGQKTGAQTVASMSKSLDGVTRDIGSVDLTKELGGSITFDHERADKEFLIRYAGPVKAGRNDLFTVDVAVRRGDRVRIAGSNGAGKTSLILALLDQLSIPDDRVLYLDQEISADEGAAWLAEVNSMSPSERGHTMSIVATLGADPAVLLESDRPSPGEIRKLALAIGLGTAKWLLVLDEPTNHLDLPSVERIQEALVSYPGALILVTHDDALAEATTTETWTVTGETMRLGDPKSRIQSG
jgi:ATPase subunit of ABC transporter with duplicated ATPase domains